MSAHWDIKAGDQVVCIDAQWHDRLCDTTPCPLVEGDTYTVVSVAVSDAVHRGRTGHLSLVLAEVSNPEGARIGFAASRFRPIQKRKTSIAVFQSLLLDPFVKIGEDA